MTDQPCRFGVFGSALLLWCCSSAPAPAPERSMSVAPAPVVPRRRADVPDDCAEVAGQPPPEALRIPYTGVAKAARCQREVYTIMGGVTHFLGVECKHCHVEPDYAADTHNKRVANWMAKELVPRLAQRTGGEVWCKDCHAGRAKFLGNPRRADIAIDWMLTHLVEDFQTTRGLPPKCKDCHGGDLGSPEFHPKIILTALAGPPLPPSAATTSTPAAPASAPAAAPAAPAAPASAPAAPASAVPSASPLPDFGGR